MADPVKLTIVHLIASTGFYGGENVVANICKTVQECPTVIICLTSSPENIVSFQEEIRELTYVQFIITDKSQKKTFALLARLSRENGSLVIHAHGYKETFIASVFQLFYRCRVVVTQHGFTARNRKSQFYNFINKFCCRFGNVYRVIAVSKSIYTAYENFGVPLSRLSYLPNGLRLEKFKTSTDSNYSIERLKTHQALNEVRPTILFAGRLSAEKDPLLFLRAFFMLKKCAPETRAVIAGDGPMRIELEEQLSQMGLEQDVTFLGFVSDLTTLLKQVDILLLTSITEGVPLVILEAMAAGTAVVASSVGDIPIIIQSGVNGVTVDSRAPEKYADSCCELLKNKKLGQELTDCAKKTVEERYNLERQKDFYLKLYQLERLV